MAPSSTTSNSGIKRNPASGPSSSKSSQPQTGTKPSSSLLSPDDVSRLASSSLQNSTVIDHDGCLSEFGEESVCGTMFEDFFPEKKGGAHGFDEELNEEPFWGYDDLQKDGKGVDPYKVLNNIEPLRIETLDDKSERWVCPFCRTPAASNRETYTFHLGRCKEREKLVAQERQAVDKQAGTNVELRTTGSALVTVGYKSKLPPNADTKEFQQLWARRLILTNVPIECNKAAMKELLEDWLQRNGGALEDLRMIHMGPEKFCHRVAIELDSTGTASAMLRDGYLDYNGQQIGVQRAHFERNEWEFMSERERKLRRTERERCKQENERLKADLEVTAKRNLEMRKRIEEQQAEFFAKIQEVAAAASQSAGGTSQEELQEFQRRLRATSEKYERELTEVTRRHTAELERQRAENEEKLRQMRDSQRLRHNTGALEKRIEELQGKNATLEAALIELKKKEELFNAPVVNRDLERERKASEEEMDRLRKKCEMEQLRHAKIVEDIKKDQAEQQARLKAEHDHEVDGLQREIDEYEKQKEQLERLEHHFICRVCQDHPNNMVLPCGHIYCERCMKDWARNMNPNATAGLVPTLEFRCPYCSKSATLAECIKVVDFNSLVVLQPSPS